MFPDDQLLPISALQHLIFCERQCALIHVERLWAENVFTVEGNQLHEKAHDGSREVVDGTRVARSLWLHSRKLGMIGQADVVEFHPDGRVVPVEYKRGKPKKDDSDRVQICTQAMCLEEMLDVKIELGHLYYGKRKRRTEVRLDSSLREKTLDTITRLRAMIDARETPIAVRQPKCDNCSLIELCLPDSQRLKTGANAWTDRQLNLATTGSLPETDPFEFT